MSKILFICYIILLFAIGYWCSSDYKQERCQLNYANGKYIKDVVVFTGRRNRKDPYKTNMTGTILMPYGNNVTFALILRMKTGGDFRIEAKTCETVKYKWMKEYMSQYTNLTLDKCPIPTGTYKFINLELPPKNVPIPLTKSDYTSIMVLYITATKERILDVSTILRYDPVRKGYNPEGPCKKITLYIAYHINRIRKLTSPRCSEAQYAPVVTAGVVSSGDNWDIYFRIITVVPTSNITDETIGTGDCKNCELKELSI